MPERTPNLARQRLLLSGPVFELNFSEKQKFRGYLGGRSPDLFFPDIRRQNAINRNPFSVSATFRSSAIR